jgi:prepilin-type N-terminal cleavage/methylation domain-containing protein
MNQKKAGFSVIEILIVMAIMGIILTIAVMSFSSARAKKQLEITVDSISAKLEEAKANAVSGKGGVSYGMNFTSTSYTLFAGDTFNPNSETNSSSTVPVDITITRNISGGGDTIVFSRMTGTPQTTGDIIITGTSGAATVTVGILGDISVLK